MTHLSAHPLLQKEEMIRKRFVNNSKILIFVNITNLVFPIQYFLRVVHRGSVSRIRAHQENDYRKNLSHRSGSPRSVGDPRAYMRVQPFLTRWESRKRNMNTDSGLMQYRRHQSRVKLRAMKAAYSPRGGLWWDDTCQLYEYFPLVRVPLDRQTLLPWGTFSHPRSDYLYGYWVSGMRWYLRVIHIFAYRSCLIQITRATREKDASLMFLPW